MHVTKSQAGLMAAELDKTSKTGLRSAFVRILLFEKGGSVRAGEEMGRDVGEIETKKKLERKM